jgi:hypothetical protein
MKVVTLDITRRAAPDEYELKLRHGAPFDNGKSIATAIARLQIDRVTARKAITDPPNPAILKEIGETLGAFLLSGDVGKSWSSLADTIQREDRAWSTKTKALEGRRRISDEEKQLLRNPPLLRTYLTLPDDKEIRGLPWELARNPAPLFLKRPVPFIRYREIPGGNVPVEREREIRLLVVIAAQNLDKIKSLEEVRSIRRATHEVNRVVHMEILKQPSREKLNDRLKGFRPHIFHFIGHANPQGLRIYDGDAKQIRTWGPIEIGQDLVTAGLAPELAFLNACETDSPADQDAVWDIGQAFIQNGTPAIIGMQAEVRGEMAGLFAGEFYRAIAAGTSIDVALTLGRLKVAERVLPETRDAYLPVLTVTTSPDEILRHQAEVDVESSDDLTEPLQHFVNRSEQRCRLLHEPDKEENPVIVVSGEDSIGKSSLLRWCTDGWLRRGFTVRYVNVAGCDDWLAVLRTIRDGQTRKRGPLHAPLDADARSYFNWRLDSLAKGVVRSEGQAPENEPDPGVTLEKLTAAVPDAHVHVLEAFHLALLRMVKRRPLVLVLDQFDAGDHGLARGYFDFIKIHWLDKFVLNAPGLNVVLGLKEKSLADFGLNVDAAHYYSEPVEKFSDSVELVRELFVLKYGDKRLPLVEQELQKVDEEELLSGADLEDYCQTLHKLFKYQRVSS